MRVLEALKEAEVDRILVTGSQQDTLLERIETALATADLPPLAWYDVLWELEKAEQGRLRMHQIADRIVLSRSNLTRLADRLEKAGLIAREACPDDRRGAAMEADAQATAAGFDDPRDAEQWLRMAEQYQQVKGPLLDALLTQWRGQGPLHLPGGVRARRAQDRLWLGAGEHDTMGSGTMGHDHPPGPS